MFSAVCIFGVRMLGNRDWLWLPNACKGGGECMLLTREGSNRYSSKLQNREASKTEAKSWSAIWKGFMFVSFRHIGLDVYSLYVGYFVLGFARLSLCEKALAEYLDTKRLAFPRFYFISSADLLDILSNGTNPQLVRHPRCFPMIEIALCGMHDSADRPLQRRHCSFSAVASTINFFPFQEVFSLWITTRWQSGLLYSQFHRSLLSIVSVFYCRRESWRVYLGVRRLTDEGHF